MPTDPKATELTREQAYVDMLFAHLDEEIDAAHQRIQQVLANEDPANPKLEALVQREIEYHDLNRKLDRLGLAQTGLVFGRIDLAEHTRYIGRMGLDDKDDNYRTLLLDWRADQARPFYLATTAQPEGVRLRRHLRTTGRKVTDFHDEVLAPEGLDTEGLSENQLTSESALFEAMQQARGSHMNSIVSTIQREQDDIIRDPARGVMVVQGGPGTGKTAVALHRVAYLLYTWREQLARTGVLIVGPNRTFLNYISQVLPELGETGVVLATLGELFPGVTGTAKESLLAQEVKGSAEMVTILARTVRSYQRVPYAPVAVRVGSLSLDITPEVVRRVRRRTRSAHRPHNDARALFMDLMLTELSQQMAELVGKDPLGGPNLCSAADIAAFHDDLSTEPDVLDALDELWPELSPQAVLHNLLCSEALIARVAYDYDEQTQAGLLHPRAQELALCDVEQFPWSERDIALLDELAALLGMPDPTEQREAEERAWQEQIQEAQDALDMISSSANSDLDDEFDAEILSAFDVIDATQLAARQQMRDGRTTAQRAAADHTWSYGHVVVDEAQELTPMDWRMIMRHSPTRWMTLVGDVAQTSAPSGVEDWAAALEPFVQDRFRTHELSVNYRTPRPIAELANQVLATFAPQQQPAQALRDSDTPVRYYDQDQAVALAAQLGQGERSCALIAPDDHQLVAQGQALGVSTIKGLEFDHVVVLDPSGIVEASPQGWQDLYVTLTRATQSLHICGAMPL